MTRVGVAKIKAGFSGYLKRVKAGQEVLITERGLPVARLVPLEGEQHQKTLRAQLIRDGLLIPGRGKIRDSLLEPPPKPTGGKTLLEYLLEEREEGR